MKEARLYDRMEGDIVRCRLCRHGCRIESDKTGICRVRKNERGTLLSLVYDKLISANADPVEKKPLYHVAPGSRSFSIATVGCNFRCSFCQNHSISQMPEDQDRIVGDNISPADIARTAAEQGCRTIAFTYTEPTIFYELARDTMYEANAMGLKNVFVTNGYMSRDMLDDCRGLLHAANVDLKAFHDDFYRTYCKARLEGVLDSLRYMAELGIWLEITTLLIPTLNDTPAELRSMAQWIKTELGAGVPWHVSRFHPQYREKGLPPTDEEFVRSVRQIGIDAGLHYVYTGNVRWEPGGHTLCPGCTEKLIDRTGYVIRDNRITEGKCPNCGRHVEGLEM